MSKLISKKRGEAGYITSTWTQINKKQHGSMVCVCLEGEESERIWNKCEKGKGKEDERRLSVSVMNSPSPFVQG